MKLWISFFLFIFFGIVFGAIPTVEEVEEATGIRHSEALREAHAFLTHNFNETDYNHYPFNITDLYEANWSLLGNNKTIMRDSLDFKEEKGRIYLELSSEKTEIDTIHLLKGRRLGIHDGTFTTDAVLEYSVQGFYIPDLGAAYLILNPLIHDNILNDFTVDLQVTNKSGAFFTSNFTNNIVNSILESELRTLNVLERGVINDTKPQVKSLIRDHRIKRDQRCFMILSIKFKPVSSSFNEQWEYFYNPEKHKEFLEDRKLNGNDESEMRPKLEFAGYLYSIDCNFETRVEAESLTFSTLQKKAIHYALFTSALTILQIVLAIKQMEYTSTQSMIVRVSTLTVISQTVMDCYLFILHITSAVFMDVTFNSFAFVAFLEFSLFALFNLRYFFMLWKARRPNEPPETRTSSFYLRFYGLIIATPVIVYIGKMMFSFSLFFLFSFLLPQIYKNAKQGSSRALQKKYVVGMAITRFFLPAYLLGCPENFARTQTRPWSLIVCGIWLSVQVIVLLLQDRFGARFFVPGSMLPEKYNYRRPLVRLDEEGRECVICMSTVDADEDYMLTPCDHLFHADCLTRWTDQKMECPTCRGRLPVL